MFTYQDRGEEVEWVMGFLEWKPTESRQGNVKTRIFKPTNEHRRNEERGQGGPWDPPIRSKIGKIRSKMGEKVAKLGLFGVW